MDKKQLKSLDYFSIENNYALIEWNGPVDIYKVNLEDTIQIRDFRVDVYENVESYLKPSVGKKLNRQSRITYKSTKLNQVKNQDQFL